MSAPGPLFSADQWERLTEAFHRGSRDASTALSKWTGGPAKITIDGLQQLPLEDVGTALPQDDAPQCFCVAPFAGELSGRMLLAFDDGSGLKLADMLSGREMGSTTQWDELTTSAALETANIVCCAFLNALAETLVSAGTDLLPAPPTFCRDFAESVLQFALMDQLVEQDAVILVQTRFSLAGTATAWSLLWIPDGETVTRLQQLPAAPAEDRP